MSSAAAGGALAERGRGHSRSRAAGRGPVRRHTCVARSLAALGRCGRVSPRAGGRRRWQPLEARARFRCAPRADLHLEAPSVTPGQGARRRVVDVRKG